VALFRSARSDVEQIGLCVVAVLFHETSQTHADEAVTTIGGTLDPLAQGAGDVSQFIVVVAAE